ncbi:MAG: glycosyl hydrolase family 28 protein [Bacteroidales bacterium]|nr:glycosyl hydrolase family 28 protein [Bacteroidales bacterium]MCM1146955.1 glycosyl hydrolase family 28 protein [Bacteroidales bacterium]MCM1206998.1 glycosyl hydrolase family 28 protein [Bacillota bacterium]
MTATAQSRYTPETQRLRDSILSTITGSAVIGKEQKVLSLKAFKGDFNRAMRKAEKFGGARIIVPKGEWKSDGPINFVSNVTLELKEGATIKFNPDPSLYPPVPTSWEGTMLHNISPFIYGKNLHDIAIVGKGTIDGNAMSTFAKWRPMQLTSRDRTREMNHREMPVSERRFTKDDYLRPPLIQFFDCRNITIEGVFITNSPFWCLHLLRSENIVCRGLRYDAKLVNNDGIDPEYSRNLLIEDIHFNNGDDNIAIKAGRDNDGWANSATPSENIIIRNCHFKGLHAVVLGSEMSAGVRNVFVEDCDYAGYCKRGIYIKTNPDRGGYVRNLFVRNCRFDTVEDLLYITTQYAGEGKDSAYPSEIDNISVDGLSCRKATAAAIVVQGTERRPVTGVSLKNIEVGEAKNAISLDNCLPALMQDIHIGGKAGIPSQAGVSK